MFSVFPEQSGIKSTDLFYIRNPCHRIFKAIGPAVSCSKTTLLISLQIINLFSAPATASHDMVVFNSPGIQSSLIYDISSGVQPFPQHPPPSCSRPVSTQKCALFARLIVSVSSDLRADASESCIPLYCKTRYIYYQAVSSVSGKIFNKGAR